MKKSVWKLNNSLLRSPYFCHELYLNHFQHFKNNKSLYVRYLLPKVADEWSLTHKVPCFCKMVIVECTQCPENEIFNFLDVFRRFYPVEVFLNLFAVFFGSHLYLLIVLLEIHLLIFIFLRKVLAHSLEGNWSFKFEQFKCYKVNIFEFWICNCFFILN